MISEQQKQALFVEIHKAIEEATVLAIERFSLGQEADLAYPPNGGLTEKEKSELTKLSINSNQKSALRKIIADAASYPIFRFLTLLDGVSDPEGYEGDWPGFTLQSKDDNFEDSDTFLHDDMDSAYWEWRKIRPSSDWKLDNLDDERA
ncbi:hypothetical protein [Candidatus Leptofilum sp.]|uniref:hypothetical protein n=1 Tax=Candidatus Leptofilum sp. TaxID=3241576 RepID=UPI003B5B630B